MGKLFVVRQILGADFNSAHYNHLHVDVYPKMTGTPPEDYPGVSQGVKVLYAALESKFGPGAYFLDNDAGKAAWTHMGWYNRRRIAGSSSWSQHAWANALDIGPYYGVKEQKPFRDFLLGLEEPNKEDIVADDVGAQKGLDDAFKDDWAKMLEWAIFTKYTDPDKKVRAEELAAFMHRAIAREVDSRIRDEIQRVLGQLQTGTVNLGGKTLVVEVKEVR